MKKLVYLSLCFTFCLSLLAAEADKPVTNYRELKVSPLNHLQVQKPERYVMENGMTVYLLEDHSVPLVNAQMLIYAGSRWEPISKAGVASITGEVIRSGGSEKFPGDILDDELDGSATSLEVGVGRDSGSASINALVQNFDRSLEILSDILQHPTFPQEKIDLCKQEMAGSILRRNDSAPSICSREFLQLLYGKDTPYGHLTELPSLAQITRQDLIAFHKEYFQPQNIILGVWGDFDSATLKAQLTKHLGSWAKGTTPRPVAPAIEDSVKDVHGIFLVEKTDVEQSFVRMGHLGGLESDDDFYALVLMDNILGGGFSSRLFSGIRSAKGLAYSVGSRWTAGMDFPGTFLCVGSTKLASTTEFIKAIQDEVNRVRTEEVTEEELSRAKDSYLNGFVFAFDSVGKIVSRLMSYEYYGYPPDTLDRFQTNIAKVTQADILAAAKKHLHPEKMVILVVGNSEKFDKPLSEFGELKTLDITILGAE